MNRQEERTNDCLDRRTFLQLGSQVVVSASLGALPASWLPSAKRTTPPGGLVVVLVADDNETGRGAARTKGVIMGAEEAARSAKLFGGHVRLERFTAQDTVDESIARLAPSSGEVIAVIEGETADACARTAAACARANVIYMNVLCSSDELRGRGCRRHMFHVAPSEAMLADAHDEASEAVSGRDVHVTSWHSALRAFGADTLNQRFRNRFHEPMTDESWAGWFAVKALAEAVLRASHVSTEGLVAHFESERAGFDGHKGRPLSFRPWNHQLRQPLYLVGRSSDPIVELPMVRSNTPTPVDSRDILDALGGGRAKSSCQFAPAGRMD